MCWTILLEFLRNPKRIGALTASSRALSRRIVSSIDLSTASVILEYGPGTGAFTSRILREKAPDARLWAIENNRRLAEKFRRRFPNVILFEETAENAPDIVQDMGARKVDCVVSGLPWATFDAPLQDRLLDATLEILREGGTFVTFAYLTGLMLRSGKRFREKLTSCFSQVTTSPIVWWNLPPAFVYQCAR